MLDIRKRLFIIIGLLAGIILSILLFILYGKDVKVPEILQKKTEEKKVITDSKNNPVPTSTAAVPDVIPPEAVNLTPRQLAKLFVERFGTYSNQNNNTHIADALLLATPSMSKWLETQSRDQESNYLGVTTKVMAVRVKESGDNATAGVEVEQVVSTSSGEEKKQRTGRVEMLLLKGVWKVDGLYWDK
jgi:hypothetical protein